jgi:hypothetical protein
MCALHVVVVQKHPNADGQHRLSQEDIKRTIEQHDNQRGNDGKHVKQKIGTKCENAACDQYWLFRPDINCQQCMGVVQCLGCGRFLCMTCRQQAKEIYGTDESCDQHSKKCQGCA